MNLIELLVTSHLKILVKWVWNMTPVLINSYNISLLRSRTQMPPWFNELVMSVFINGGLEMVRNLEIQFLQRLSLSLWHFGTQQREAFVPACVHDIVLDAEGDCSDNAWLCLCISKSDSIECITILRRKSLVKFCLNFVVHMRFEILIAVNNEIMFFVGYDAMWCIEYMPSLSREEAHLFNNDTPLQICTVSSPRIL